MLWQSQSETERSRETPKAYDWKQSDAHIPLRPNAKARFYGSLQTLKTGTFCQIATFGGCGLCS